MTEQQKSEFIRLRIEEGLSLKTIAGKMGLDALTLVGWESELEQELKARLTLYVDQRLHEGGADAVKRVDYLLATYKRLATELDTRDFSGLPTDKLYFILNDLYELIKKSV